jgi:hypothetical protein
MFMMRVLVLGVWSAWLGGACGGCALLSGSAPVVSAIVRVVVAVEDLALAHTECFVELRNCRCIIGDLLLIHEVSNPTLTRGLLQVGLSPIKTPNYLNWCCSTQASY